MPSSSSSSSDGSTAADRYESADPAGSSSSGDTEATGKYYRILVPDFTATGSDTAPGSMTSYLRLGVVDPATDRGEDLADAAGLDDEGLHTLGGVRDHTDGNRIVTTRGHKVEVVGGQHRLLVNVAQTAGTSPLTDPKWVEIADEVVRSYVGHTYAETYYELISTTDVLYPSSGTSTPSSASSSSASSSTATGQYAEPRRLTTTVRDGELYEYFNGVDVTEILAASADLTEKTYAGNAVLEVTSTVRASYEDWETLNWGPSYDPSSSSSRAPARSSSSSSTAAPTDQPFPGLQAGDVVDYMFADRFIEVIRAHDLTVDKIYGDRLLEVISTTHVNDRSPLGAPEPWRRRHYPWEPDPGTLASGDLYEIMNGADVVEVVRSSTDLDELFGAVSGNLVSTIEAGGDLTETVKGHRIVESYTATSSITEETTARDKSSMTYLSSNLTELVSAKQSYSVSLSALGGDVDVTALKLEADLALVHTEINTILQSIETDVGLSMEIKNLQLKIVYDEERHGLTLKNYAGVVLLG